MKQIEGEENAGFTIIEILVASVVLAIIAVAALSTYTTLQSTAIIAKHKSIATELATNQIEKLKGLPYDNLAVAGGSIVHASPLPNSESIAINSYTYTVKTSINYIDDAFDGCGNYANETIKQQLCRNYPAPATAPATDLNPADYKIVNVKVYGLQDKKLSELDTQISARVAETNSTTGALSVLVVDDSGSPISGATVQVQNSTTAPAVNVSDSTDSSGNAIFYGLPPDTDKDYIVTASKSGFSSLQTIASSGGLTPYYENQSVLTQTGSSVTLTLRPKTNNSLIVSTVDTSGNPIGGVSINIKGGYKKYNDADPPYDTEYYYSDTTKVTDPTTGLAYYNDLTPGPYFFCGDDKTTGCSGYRVVAAVASSGDHSFDNIMIPNYTSSLPLFSGYTQYVRLILTTNMNLPVVSTLSPSDISSSSDLSNIDFTLRGQNLTCSVSSCATSVSFRVQAGPTYTASCLDPSSSGGTQMDCNIDLSGATTGMKYLEISNSGGTLTIPFWSDAKGGINVSP